MVEIIVVKMVDLGICHKHVGSIVTKVWFKLLIEIKNWKILQICRHECNGLSKPPSFYELKKLLKHLCRHQSTIY
jgi:hypothetical protein